MHTSLFSLNAGKGYHIPFVSLAKQLTSPKAWHSFVRGIPYILMKFANPVPGCVISGPVRYRISPDLGLNNEL